ncbi:hypothetical protein [Bacteroides sp. 519]|uniref:hypothetical protein n=1 Tax=Bacteroides sp. 519 TaxID=2302937 RepID=UPI0013D615E6|nr:hypothetical protein [Bacteroides sp. 519]NDV58229.1 hypothetical protein [Bacteroides sp. 519]
MTEIAVIQEAFPLEIREEIKSLLTKFDIETMHSTKGFEKAVVGEGIIDIPSRIYYRPPYSLNDSKFTQTEKEILNCIFSRHSDGYIRQKAILNIISSDKEWTIPYVMRIIGEYVIEILIDINKHFERINKSNLVLFIQQNPAFYNRIHSRVGSYWDCYYRYQFPEKLKGIKVPEEQRYVGFQLLDKIDRTISL